MPAQLQITRTVEAGPLSACLNGVPERAIVPCEIFTVTVAPDAVCEATPPVTICCTPPIVIHPGITSTSGVVVQGGQVKVAKPLALAG